MIYESDPICYRNLVIEHSLKEVDQCSFMVETHVQWNSGPGFKVHLLDNREDFLLPHLGANQIADQYRDLHRRYKEKTKHRQR